MDVQSFSGGLVEGFNRRGWPAIGGSCQYIGDMLSPLILSKNANLTQRCNRDLFDQKASDHYSFFHDSLPARERGSDLFVLSETLNSETIHASFKGGSKMPTDSRPQK